MKALPEREHRDLRASSVGRYGTAITDALLMVSRDGVKFKRWNEAFLLPGIERPGTWNYGHQYVAWHIVETASALVGAANELSLYASESYWTGKAIPNFTLDDFPVIFGDTTDRIVRWDSGADVSQLAGRPVRLHFELQDADLY